MTPLLELVLFNLMFLGVFLIRTLGAEWWESRGGVKALPRLVMIAVGTSTAIVINIFLVTLYLGSR